MGGLGWERKGRRVSAELSGDKRRRICLRIGDQEFTVSPAKAEKLGRKLLLLSVKAQASKWLGV